MRFKIGNDLSDLKSITGGAIQGSVLGVMNHNAVLEFINDDVDQEMYKYIDDLTLEEVISRDVPYLIDSSGEIATLLEQKTLRNPLMYLVRNLL